MGGVGLWISGEEGYTFLEGDGSDCVTYGFGVGRGAGKGGIGLWISGEGKWRELLFGMACLPRSRVSGFRAMKARACRGHWLSAVAASRFSRGGSLFWRPDTGLL
jgi:hypothetical protein